MPAVALAPWMLTGWSPYLSVEQAPNSMNLDGFLENVCVFEQQWNSDAIPPHFRHLDGQMHDKLGSSLTQAALMLVTGEQYAKLLDDLCNADTKDYAKIIERITPR